jgi:hypothetical protein
VAKSEQAAHNPATVAKSEQAAHNLPTLAKSEQAAHNPPKATDKPPTEGRSEQAAHYRPTIIVNNRDLDAVLRDVVLALENSNDPPLIYNHGGHLTAINPDPVAHDLVYLQYLSRDALRNLLGEIATYVDNYDAEKGFKVYIVFPPVEIVRGVMAMRTWSPKLAPPLDAVISAPCYSERGVLITTPGFHAHDRLFYHPAAALQGLHVPLCPTQGEVDWALNLIDELLVDFHFAEPASRANAIALMLLFFVRRMIDGPTPFHMIGASTEGTGKSKLANALIYPARGRELYSTPPKESDAEWRKAITSRLKSGDTHFYVDNITNDADRDGLSQALGSASFAAALTQRHWQDRRLGGNEEFRGPIQLIWVGSGNNVEFTRELCRRTVPITLMSTVQDPSQRKDFLHDPLEPWIYSQHRDLTRASLIICQNWIAKGKPTSEKTMGSYEQYARIMGGILEAANINEFLENQPKLLQQDKDSLRWPPLLYKWWRSDQKKPFRTCDMYVHIHTYLFGEQFADVLGDKSELSQKQRLGHALSKQEGRVWGPFHDENGKEVMPAVRVVRSDARGAKGETLYVLEPVGTGREPGDDPAEPGDHELAGHQGKLAF